MRKKIEFFVLKMKSPFGVVCLCIIFFFVFMYTLPPAQQFAKQQADDVVMGGTFEKYVEDF